jgi:pyrroloquinoline quinone (PQQ) biosynthesis protein C
MLATRTDQDLRDIIVENLEEELNPRGPHPKLWRDFAAAVGVDEDSLADSVPMFATEVLVELYSDTSSLVAPAISSVTRD